MSTAVSTRRAPGQVQATLRYLPDFQEMLEGELRAGGQLHLDYAIERVACRRERLGVPIWSFQSFLRFHPGGQLYHGGIQVSVPIPSDATEAELWFYSSNIMACSAWDSHFGQNYLYRPWPGQTEHAANRTQASDLTDAHEALGPQDHLLLNIDTDARPRHWLVCQPLCLWTANVKMTISTFETLPPEDHHD